MKTVTDEQLAETQARLNALPLRSVPYADLLASFIWQPIATYDKAAAPTVLFRRGERVCAGSWATATIWLKPNAWQTDADLAATWRSAEDASLETPLSFEPEEFAVLDDTALRGFIAT